MKQKYTVRMDKQVADNVDEIYAKNGFNSRSEFIEIATEFYLEYVISQTSADFLATAIEKSLDKIIEKNISALNNNIYRLALEQAMTMHILAAGLEISDDDIYHLRGMCIEKLNETRARYTFKDVLEWQSRR